MPSIIKYLNAVNEHYRYETSDFHPILAARVCEIKKDRPNCFSIHDRFFNAENLCTIKSKLLNERNRTNEPRKLLIPYVLTGTHTIGILLEIKSDGTIEKALYMDSLLADGENPDQRLQNEIAAVFPDCILKLHPCMQQRQGDVTGSGPYTISNLIYAAQQKKIPEDTPSSQRMRALHLQALDEHNKDFYKEFDRRQRAARARVYPPGAENVTPVQDNIAELYATLNELNFNLNRLLSVTAVSQEEAQISSESRELFTIVCDEHGVLRPQLRDAAQSRRVAKFLPVRDWSTDKIGVVSDMGYNASFGAAGGSSLYLLTVGNEAYQAWRAGLSITQVLSIGVSAFNPTFLFASMIIGAYISAGSQYQERQFAKAIAKAASLSSSANNQNLKEAEKLLLEHGAGASKAPFYRGLGWFSMSDDEVNFADLLLAQIQTQLQRSNTYQLFVSVYQDSKNPLIKGMALVKIINLLSKATPSTLTGRLLSPDIRMQELDKHVKTLNGVHIYKGVVTQYLNKVLLAYGVLFLKVENREFLKSRQKFAETKFCIDQMIKFEDLHCFRYMGPHGKIGEVVFTFIQALCYNFYEEHYRAMGRDFVAYASNPTSEADASNLTQEKLRDCEELIRTFGLDDSMFANTTTGAIIASIRNYRSRYAVTCAQREAERHLVHDNQFNHQFYMHTRRPLTQTQIARIATNTHGNSNEDGNESDREAQQISLRQRYTGGW